MTNSEIRTTKNIKLKEEDKMMKLDLYESRLFGRICYGFGRDEDGYPLHEVLIIMLLAVICGAT